MDMSDNEFNKEDLVEIDHLVDRARKSSRRDVLRAGRNLAFAIPALAMASVSRQALGKTGSGKKPKKDKKDK
jgi:hypothetical protein